VNILVCIKQVPHPDYISQIVLDPVTNRVRREGIPFVINPVDGNAIELGLQAKEKFLGKVIVFSMGPPTARGILEEALAMGADEAVLLCDRSFAGSDTFATARTLAAAIAKFPFDLILCGNETIDSGTSHVGPQLAEFLDIPHTTNAKSIEFLDERLLLVERSLGHYDVKIEMALPALITVRKESCQPRLPDVIGIMTVAAKELKTYGLGELGLSPEEVGVMGSPTTTIHWSQSKQDRRREILQGEAKQVARQAVTRLRELGII